MNNKELLKRKEELLKEIDKIDEELSKPECETVKVIHFRGNTVGCGEEIGNYEMFDVLWRLTDVEYRDLIYYKEKDMNFILCTLSDIIDNHDDIGINKLDIIDDLFNLYRILYFNKEKTIKTYPCELYITFGDELNDSTDISLKLLEVPIEVYNKFENVCISRKSLDPDC